MDPVIALALTMGFALAFAAIGGALSQSRAIVAALEGMARQPEAAGSIQTAMIIGLALIESLVIYVLIIAFILNGHLGTAITNGLTNAGKAVAAAAGAH